MFKAPLFFAILFVVSACGGGSATEFVEPTADDPAQEMPTPQPTPVTPEPAPNPQPEPTPSPEPTPQPEPEYLTRISFDGVTAYVLSFSTSQFGRLQVNSLFKNNTINRLDAQCRITLTSGLSEVDFQFISVDDLASGEKIPDRSAFLGDGLTVDSFDSFRLSDCFTLSPSEIYQTRPEPDFSYVERVAFGGVEVFVLGFGYNQFGRLEVNGLVINNRSETVDIQCEVTLLSGNLVVEEAYISVDDVVPGESVPDRSSFLNDNLSEESFDRVRLSGCFTL